MGFLGRDPKLDAPSALPSGNDQDGTRRDLEEAGRDAPQGQPLQRSTPDAAENDEVGVCCLGRIGDRMGRPADLDLMDLEVGFQTVSLQR